MLEGLLSMGRIYWCGGLLLLEEVLCCWGVNGCWRGFAVEGGVYRCCLLEGLSMLTAGKSIVAGGSIAAVGILCCSGVNCC